MIRSHLYMLRFLVPLLVMIVILFGKAEAKEIDSGLWGISWADNPGQVRQTLEKQGFIQAEVGKESNGSTWQTFGQGRYSGFLCDIKVVWQKDRLTQISIDSKEVFPQGIDYTYKNLVTRFTNQYGQPQARDRYMLKRFPGIWVEWVSWTVNSEGGPAYTVTLTMSSPAYPEPEAAQSSKITILFSGMP